jgi:hypothetical protein
MQTRKFGRLRNPKIGMQVAAAAPLYESVDVLHLKPQPEFDPTVMMRIDGPK